MKFIVKLQAEITIKSRPVRKRFTKILESNVKNVLRRVDDQLTTRVNWDNIEVNTKNNSPENRLKLIETLKCIPGVPAFLEVQQMEFTDLHDVFEKTLAVHAKTIENKTFCVRAKRTGTHEFKSLDVEQYVGGGLNQHVESAKVKLKKPDVTIRLEIKNNVLNVVSNTFKGLGGFPIATQEDVLSLMSGGFDSGVASYQMIKKGSRTHFCFFNLGGSAHEGGVKQVSYYLWDKFGASHRTKFYAVDFEPVVAEILEKIENGQMGVVLKRMMMRAAAKVAEEEQGAAIAGITAAELYGLDVAASSIQDEDHNSTRFLVLSQQAISRSGNDKTSIVVYADNKPGALFRVLEPFEQLGLSLTKIETRPSRKEAWDYLFFIDFEGHGEEEKVKTLFQRLQACTAEVKLLGSYPRA